MMKPKHVEELDFAGPDALPVVISYAANLETINSQQFRSKHFGC